MLFEIDDRRILADPVWSERVSPSQLVGPKRFFVPPLALDKLPNLDAVVLSHDHYDHLDPAAIRVLDRTGMPFFCPLGVGAHLRRWGVPAVSITELSWWESARLGDDFTLVATPARHFSGRGLTSNNTLWASWCLLGPTHKVFFGGDSGPFKEGFRQIGEAWAVRFDDAGNRRCRPRVGRIHLGPDHAFAAHRLLGGGPLLPLHWGTFNLAFHAWRQPVQRLLEAAGEVPLLLPAPGQRVDVAAGPLNSQWWER